MSKTIQITGKWAGSVTFADPLNIPQAQLIEAGMKMPEGGENGRIWLSVIDAEKIPAIIGCAEKIELSNFPEAVTFETFPASPRKESHDLIDKLFAELLTVYFGAAKIPNE